MHTVPLLGVWAENLFHCHQYPSRASGITCILVLNATYVAWIHYLHHAHWLQYKISLWVYPILNQLPFFYRTLFLIGAVISSVGFYFVGEYYNQLVRGIRSQTTKSMKNS